MLLSKDTGRGGRNRRDTVQLHEYSSTNCTVPVGRIIIGRTSLLVYSRIILLRTVIRLPGFIMREAPAERREELVGFSTVSSVIGSRLYGRVI